MKNAGMDRDQTWWDNGLGATGRGTDASRTGRCEEGVVVSPTLYSLLLKSKSDRKQSGTHAGLPVWGWYSWQCGNAASLQGRNSGYKGGTDALQPDRWVVGDNGLQSEIVGQPLEYQWCGPVYRTGLPQRGGRLCFDHLLPKTTSAESSYETRRSRWFAVGSNRCPKVPAGHRRTSHAK